MELYDIQKFFEGHKVSFDGGGGESLNRIQELLEEEGPGCLLEHHGSIIEVIRDVANVHVQRLQQAVRIVRSAIEQYCATLNELKRSAPDGILRKLDNDVIKEQRCIGALLCYFIHQFFKEFEQRSGNEMVVNTETARQLEKKTRKVIENKKSRYYFWEDQRPKYVSLACELLTSPINELLGTSDDNLVARCVMGGFIVTYNFRPDVVSRQEDVCHNLQEGIGIMSSKFNLFNNFILRTIPQMSTELSASVICELLGTLETTFRMETVFQDALKVCYDILTKKDDAHRSGRKTDEKAITSFIVACGQNSTRGVLCALPLFLQFLRLDSANVRGAVLIAFRDIWLNIDEESVHDFNEGRDEVWNAFMEHTRDESAIIRSKSLGIVEKLLEGKPQHSLLTISELYEALRHCSKRVADKAVTVRKAAIALITAIIHRENPIAIFSDKELGKRAIAEREKLFVKLRDMFGDFTSFMKRIAWEFVFFLKIHGKCSHDLDLDGKEIKEFPKMILESLEAWKIWDACVQLKYLVKICQNNPGLPSEEDLNIPITYIRYFERVKELGTEEDEDFEMDGGALNDPDIMHVRNTVIYFETCRKMSKSLAQCQEHLRSLLLRGENSEKLEILEFLCELSKMGYKPDEFTTRAIVEASTALTKLKTSRDSTEKFFEIFFINCLDEPFSLVKRLIEIYQAIPESGKDRMGPLIRDLYAKNMNRSHIEVLWDVFALRQNEWRQSDSLNAARIITVIASPVDVHDNNRRHRDILMSNMDMWLNIGLGERGLNDFAFARLTLTGLLEVCKAPADVKMDIIENMRFSPTHHMFEKVFDLIKFGLVENGNQAIEEKLNQEYSKVVELGIQMIYRMCTEPISLTTKLLENVYQWVFDENAIVKTCECVQARYLNVYTSLLNANLFYYEVVITSVVRRRKEIAEEHKKKLKKNKKNGNNKRQSIIPSLRELELTLNQSRAHDVTTVSSNAEYNEELDAIVGNLGFDQDTDRIRTFIDKMCEEGSFRQFKLLVMKMAESFMQIKSYTLKVAVVNAIVKIMYVCPKYMEACFTVYSNIWNYCKEPLVKCEVIKGAVVLNRRFPNQMEGMNSLISSRIAQEHRLVRVAFMDFVAFLGLGELVKIKDQMEPAAMLLVDQDEFIQDLAKDFFEELGNKEVLMNNVMPDIIGKLSARDDLGTTDFQFIMKYLLQKIKKDKYQLNMVEKILNRFKGIQKGRQAQNNAFCLSQLPISEKSLKAVVFNLTSFSTLLADDEVFSVFDKILKTSKARKESQFKTLSLQLETDLMAAREKCLTQEETERKAENARNRKQRVVLEVVNDEPDFSDEEEENTDQGADDDATDQDGNGNANNARKNGEIQNVNGATSDGENEEEQGGGQGKAMDVANDSDGDDEETSDQDSQNHTVLARNVENEETSEDEESSGDE